MSGIFPEGLDNDKVVQFANCVVNIYIDQSAVVPPYIWQIIYLEKDSKRSTRWCENLMYDQLCDMFYHSCP